MLPAASGASPRASLALLQYRLTCGGMAAEWRAGKTWVNNDLEIRWLSKQLSEGTKPPLDRLCSTTSVAGYSKLACSSSLLENA